MTDSFNGLNCNLDNLFLLSNAKTRSLSAENKQGEKGGGGKGASELGVGWKGSPAVLVPAGKTVTTADIEGPGAINSIWMGGYIGPQLVLRIYWDGQEVPSVECPLNTFFAYGVTTDVNHADGSFPTLNSLPVVVAPCRGMSCYWQMPFQRHCRITVENTGTVDVHHFYQINYTLTEVPCNAAYFHAVYREEKPVRYKVPYTVVDGIQGRGQYVGTALFAKLNHSNTCWVEGEFKFYMDGDDAFPTINYTGIEDYFCGSYAWVVNGRYQTYSTPYSGMYAVVHSNGTQGSIHDSFMAYRWHIVDPIRFDHDLRVTVMDLGWNETTTGFAPRCDDFSSVAYWYQTLPTSPLIYGM